METADIDGSPQGSILLYTVLYILVFATLLMWILRLVVLGLIERMVPTLRPHDEAENAPAEWPRMSILVAAKDEEANIEACIRSMFAQTYPNLEIICVDDRSSDETPAILRRLATEDDRLKFTSIASLPDGWFGKNNAMHQAVEMATGEWLCFTDADCILGSPHSLATSMKHALDVGAEFLSILPEHEVLSRWERIVQPACSAVMMLWFSPIAVNRGKVAYANGAFMLMQRSCYEAIGGHAAVRAEVNEDIHLARRARASGQRLVVTSARGLYTVRMYDSFARIWSGWTRIFVGSFANTWQIVRAAIVLLYFTFLPWAALVACALAPDWGWGSWHGLAWVATASCVIQIAAMAFFYRLGRIPVRYVLLYPLGGVIALAALVNATKCATAGGSFTWRGTRYRNGAAEQSAAA